MTLARRIGNGPLLKPKDISPSSDGLEVVGVLNPAAAIVDREFVLLVRVAERVRAEGDLPPDALTVDMNGPTPVLKPLDRPRRATEVVPITVLDVEAERPRITVAYLPKELRGLDLSDPRGVSFTHPTTGQRTAFLRQLSHLRVARSRDGIAFVVDDEPAIFPHGHLEEYGCEDARATLIDGRWHVTYVSVSRMGITTSLATTTDFRSFVRRGVIMPPDQKDVALFPECRDGRYMALTRPMPGSFSHTPGIWIVVPDRELPWGRHTPLVLPRTGMWDERRTGAGTVPFRVDEGWLEIYHGVDRRRRYALGAVLLDPDEPSHVLARSPAPILVPELSFERTGFFPDVVYSCGHVPLDDRGRRIRVYYGAADACVAAADFDVCQIVDSLEPN
jgi:beta-1,2-mannobiose phosphorylase / 1,2-beta-oligomannan phosphorylase